MVTVVYRMTTKEGKEEAFRQIALQCQESALKTNGIITYIFYNSLTNPRSFIVYYRFKEKENQDEHVTNLIKLFGPAPEGRTLPAKFLELLEEEEVILFEDK